MKITTKQTDGSNGYTAGTWEYQIVDAAGNMWFEGGFSRRARAVSAARQRVRALTRL